MTRTVECSTWNCNSLNNARFAVLRRSQEKAEVGTAAILTSRRSTTANRRPVPFRRTPDPVPTPIRRCHKMDGSWIAGRKAQIVLKWLSDAE